MKLKHFINLSFIFILSHTPIKASTVEDFENILCITGKIQDNISTESTLFYESTPKIEKFNRIIDGARQAGLSELKQANEEGKSKIINALEDQEKRMLKFLRTVSGLTMDGADSETPLYRIKKAFHDTLHIYYKEALTILKSANTAVLSVQYSCHLGSIIRRVEQRVQYYNALMELYKKDNDSFSQDPSTLSWVGRQMGFRDYYWATPQIAILTVPIETHTVAEQALNLLNNISQTIHKESTQQDDTRKERITSYIRYSSEALDELRKIVDGELNPKSLLEEICKLDVQIEPTSPFAELVVRKKIHELAMYPRPHTPPSSPATELENMSTEKTMTSLPVSTQSSFRETRQNSPIASSNKTPEVVITAPNDTNLLVPPATPASPRKNKANKQSVAKHVRPTFMGTVNEKP